MKVEWWIFLTVFGLYVAAFSGLASANAPAQIAEPGVVEIETHDENGDARRTKIWIVSQGDKVYVRTTDSIWHANLVREQRATLYADAGSEAASALLVSDAALQTSVNELFAEKYGFANTLRNWMVAFGSANMWVLTLDTL
ncbi:MAG: DUF2255 family protein [Myxococcota bacterium]|nr:DUF2255 family protein [Myxococcota bacterium]